MSYMVILSDLLRVKVGPTDEQHRISWGGGLVRNAGSQALCRLLQQTTHDTQIPRQVRFTFKLETHHV